MSLKLKALGLGLLAIVAMSAVAVMNASANEKGHFVTTGLAHAHIKGISGPGTNHNVHLSLHGISGEIGCTTQEHTVTTTAETNASLTVLANYAGCTTTSNGQAVTVTMNSCDYTFTVAENTTDDTEQTAHLICTTPGDKVEIHHPNCTTSIHPQTVDTGLTYTTKLNPENIHEITLDIGIKFNVTNEGLCQFVTPTNGTGTLNGTATVKAFNTAKEQAHITAT